MTAPKNPYFFTDAILLRELRRRIDRKYDDRLDHLLEVVEQRLWERDFELRMSKNAVNLQRLQRLERRSHELEGQALEALDLVKTLRDRVTSTELLEDWRRRVDHLSPTPPQPRPHLTLLPGDSA